MGARARPAGRPRFSEGQTLPQHPQLTPSGEPDWRAIEAEYMAGTPRRKIVARYGIALRALDSRIKRGKWVSRRATAGQLLANKVTEESATLTAEWFAKERIAAVRESLQIAEKGIAKCLALLESSTNQREAFDAMRALRIAVSIRAEALRTDQAAREAAVDELVDDMVRLWSEMHGGAEVEVNPKPATRLADVAPQA